MQRFSRSVLVLAIAVLAGCATPHPEPQPPAANTPPPPRTTPAPPPTPQPPPDQRKPAAQIQLDEGVALYDTGDFTGAIRRLMTGNDIWSGPVPLQVQGLKYLAFSYCVTNRVSLCQQQFEKALKLDPTFDLPSAEKTHPIWGPAFARAKNPKPAVAPTAGAATTAPAPAPAAPAPKSAAPATPTAPASKPPG
jgi:hypothetical protein